MLLSSPLTHSDWLHRLPKKMYGKKSVYYMLDRCKDVGWSKIYCRCFDGGQAYYPSKYMDLEHGYDPDNYGQWATPENPCNYELFKQYKYYDCLAEAVAYGHKIGLEIHAWLSINEDDHGWGLQSRFTRRHPHFRWVKRNGLPYNSQLSFAFPEVREYKLNLLKEILKYDFDGIFFDWIRTGDVRNNPQTDPKGTADYGYEKPLVEDFKKEFKKDPFQIPNNDLDWVHYRCRPQTLFVREAKKLIKKKNKNLPVSSLIPHPWSYRGSDGPINGALHGQLLDIPTWVKEGLMDQYVAAGYYRKGGTPEKAYRYVKDLVKDSADVWLYWWVPGDIKEFQRSLQTAKKLGASQILYWEADYIDGPNQWVREGIFKNK
jgi:uncharacterized lipoprotein YddW (UPF0748 family)